MRWRPYLSEAEKSGKLSISAVGKEKFWIGPEVTAIETKVQVLKEDGRKAEPDSWMLVRSTPGAEKKIILFDYSVSRSSETMKNLFAGYAGTLQTDGLSSYDCLESENVDHVGCNMHARRRFEQAIVESNG